MNSGTIQYKLGTSLSLLLTADSLSGFVFTGATKTIQIYKSATSRVNPLFNKSWTTDISPLETTTNILPTDITLKPDVYWGSFIIEHSPSQKIVVDFQIAINLFANETISDSCKVGFKIIKNNINFKIQGAIVNGGGSAAPPRVYNENLTSQITGSNNTFTTQFPLISGSEEVRLNGITQTLIDDYIVLNYTQIQLTSILSTLDHILISYNKQ